MGFSELKQKYQFLGEILNLYDKLDQPGGENDQNKEILILCDKDPLLKRDTTGEHIKFCKKLSRNMLQLADGNYKSDTFYKYCDVLYMWMYFEIMKYSIPNNITEIIINKLTEIIKSKLINKNPCPYFNFNENYHKPTKLMKLRIFEHNTSIFKNKLSDINALNNCSCLKFIYECVNIYREMHQDYCLGAKQFEPLNKDTCDILNKFKILYMAYLFDAGGIKDKLPPLDGTNNEDFPRCLSDESKLGSAEDHVQGAEATSHGVEQSNSRLSLSTSAAVSTMVGIPPFLAIIYKFTPVGTWFRSKYRKDADVFKNVDEVIENELYYPRHENTNINSSQARYNVAYEQI